MSSSLRYSKLWIMPSNVRTFTPKKAAEEIGCSSDTIRRYCALFARHLSEGATPQAGRSRLLTQEDVYLLGVAKKQIENGLTVEEVDILLSTVAVPASMVAPAPSEALAPASPEVPEALALLRQMTSALDRMEVREGRIAKLEEDSSSKDKRIDQLEGQVEDLREALQALASPAPKPSPSPWVAYIPFGVGLAVILLVVAAVALAVAMLGK